MARHRLFLPDADPEPGTHLTIAGQEAHHAARVKRMAPGDALELLNGRGLRALGTIQGFDREPGQGRGAKPEWVLRVLVTSAEREAPLQPRLRVLAGVPKGPHLEEMIDQLSQVGAAAWSPLVTTRTVVSPRSGKMLKAERIASESAKQCGRAWTMEIGEPVPLDDALADGRQGAEPATRVIVADASGGVYEPDGSPDLTLLVGPEGGFAEGELEAARRAAAAVCRFGVHVMRVETAAVVAAGIILDAERRRPRP